MAEQKRLSLKDLVQGAHAATVNTKDMAVAAVTATKDVVKAVGETVYDSAPAAGLRAVSNTPGAAPLHAMVRQGAREIEPLLQAFPDSNVRPVDEPGQIFNPTPQLVTEQMTGKLSLDDLLSNAKDRAKAAEQRMDNHKDRGREM